MEFCSDSLRVARTFRGLTQSELAEQVTASEATIWQIEHGRTPNGSVLTALGLALGFEPEFFFQPLHDEFTEEECNFRRRPSAAQKLRRRVLARGTLFGMVVQHLSELLALPKYNVPSMAVSSMQEIERSAEKCRETWGLGIDTPIVNMSRVLEHAGVMVTRLDNESSKLDAFSRMGRDGGVTVVVLNTAKGSTSRTRFDMAHELGHVVLHQKSRTSLKEREDQANRFASAFLLPERGFAREFGSSGRIDWVRLFDLKMRWKTSLQAMIYRARDLQLIDELEFRRAYKAISVRGWRKQEPEEPPQERPELFRVAMRTLWQKKRIGAADLARQLHWSAKTFEDVTGLRSAEPDPGAHDTVLSIVREKKERHVAVARDADQGQEHIPTPHY